MKLDKYINDLLFLHDCIIISDFGGFVAHYRPSYLHKDFHTISPPAKVIAFNKDLRENDGLLANYLCKKLDINYMAACQLIQAFAANAIKELNEGRIYKIDHLGQFEYDKEKNLQFKADPESNYLISSYGLSIVHSPAITRGDSQGSTSVKKQQKKNPKKIKTLADPVKSEKKKKSVMALLEVVPVAAIMLLLLFYPSYVHTLNKKLASIIPLTNNFDSNWKNNKQVKQSQDNDLSINLGSVLINDSNQSENTKSDLKTVDDLWEEDLTENSVEIDEPEAVLNEAISSLENEKPKLPEIVIPEDNKVQESISESMEGDEANADNKIVAKTIPSGTSKYYVIGGCFSVFSNAENLVSKLQLEGFPAVLAGQNANGLHMVAFDGAATLSEAKEKLVGIKSQSYDSAWIYRPK